MDYFTIVFIHWMTCTADLPHKASHHWNSVSWVAGVDATWGELQHFFTTALCFATEFLFFPERRFDVSKGQQPQWENSQEISTSSFELSLHNVLYSRRVQAVLPNMSNAVFSHKLLKHMTETQACERVKSLYRKAWAPGLESNPPTQLTLYSIIAHWVHVTAFKTENNCWFFTVGVVKLYYTANT